MSWTSFGYEGGGIVGPPGPQGPQGELGPAGPTGPIGPKGENGGVSSPWNSDLVINGAFTVNSQTGPSDSNPTVPISSVYDSTGNFALVCAEIPGTNVLAANNLICQESLLVVGPDDQATVYVDNGQFIASCTGSQGFLVEDMNNNLYMTCDMQNQQTTFNKDIQVLGNMKLGSTTTIFPYSDGYNRLGSPTGAFAAVYSAEVSAQQVDTNVLNVSGTGTFTGPMVVLPTDEGTILSVFDQQKPPNQILTLDTNGVLNLQNPSTGDNILAVSERSTILQSNAVSLGSSAGTILNAGDSTDCYGEWNFYSRDDSQPTLTVYDAEGFITFGVDPSTETITSNLNLIPGPTAEVNLGSADVPWNEVHCTNLYAGNVNFDSSSVQELTIQPATDASGIFNVKQAAGTSLLSVDTNTPQINVNANLIPMSAGATNLGSSSKYFNNVYCDAVVIGAKTVPLISTSQIASTTTLISSFTSSGLTYQAAYGCNSLPSLNGATASQIISMYAQLSDGSIYYAGQGDTAAASVAANNTALFYWQTVPGYPNNVYLVFPWKTIEGTSQSNILVNGTDGSATALACNVYVNYWTIPSTSTMEEVLLSGMEEALVSSSPAAPTYPKQRLVNKDKPLKDLADKYNSLKREYASLLSRVQQLESRSAQDLTKSIVLDQPDDSDDYEQVDANASE